MRALQKEMGYTVVMIEGFHFGTEEQQKPPLERMDVVGRSEAITTPEDIANQLRASEENYKEYLANFKGGDNDSREYLEEMQANLITWMNLFDIKFGKMTPGTQETYGNVMSRLGEVSDVLETKGDTLH